MKSRVLWFSLTFFFVLVFAVALAFSNSLFGNTPTTQALEPALANKSLPDPIISQEVAPISDTAPAPAPEQVVVSVPDQVVIQAPQDTVIQATEPMNTAGGGNPAAEPPVAGQGGTCISGFIIDKYHHARGSGWSVTVTSPDDVSQTKTADKNGKFKFEKLAGGIWTVTLDVPSGWRPFTPSSFQVTLTGSGNNCSDVRFKMEALPCLQVTKLDYGGNMTFKDKVGIPDWMITTLQNGTVLSATTDGLGNAKFVNLVPGVITVTEESKIGWTPASGYTKERVLTLISPKNPGTCETLTFVNQQVHGGCIQIRKLDPSGKPLKGWKITIKRNDGTQPSISQTTDKNGYATFVGLALGTWTVEETVSDGWRAVGASKASVTLTEAGRCEQVRFTNEPLGCVEGYKINHLEQGLSNWKITARNQTTKEEFSTKTDANGYFKFKLPKGTWTISEEIQAGWTPVTASEFTIVVDDLNKCYQVRFKNRTDYACVDVYKIDCTDKVGIPGWTITIKPAYGGTAVTGTTDGVGHVRFNELTPGTYVISETLQSGWANVSPLQTTMELEATGTCAVVQFTNKQTTTTIPKLPTTGSGTGTGCRVVYTVKWNDTLYSLARTYGTSVEVIKKNNGLWSNNIYAGTTLCIP